MTPKVLGRELEAASLRAVDDYRRDVTLAWNISRVFFTSKGSKKLVALKSLLSDVKESDGERQSTAQMASVLGILSHQYRIPLRKKPRRGKK